MNSNSIYKSAAGEKAIMDLYDDVLKNWPVPYEAGTVPTRHGETFVISCGDKAAQPLLLLHGASSNAVSWVGDAAIYSRYFRVFAVDIPGEPGKSSPNRPSYQGPDFGEWLEDVLNGLGLDKVSLLGLSQGGWTALRFATYRPERVEKLVLLTPAGVVPTKASFLLSAIVFSLLGRRGAQQLNRIVFGKQPIHSDAVKFMDAIMTHFKARIEKEYIFSDDELARLSMPVLLIGGAEDAIRSAAKIASRMAKLVPNFQKEIIPGMGHVLVGQAGLIIPFLKSSETTGW